MHTAPAIVAIPDYFDVEQYPTMSYRSACIRQSDNGWVIDGELTLHGITRHVPLAVEVNGFRPDPFGGHRAGFSATAQINRRDEIHPQQQGEQSWKLV
jgi:polyisoprenoid-binding protein YceI